MSKLTSEVLDLAADHIQQRGWVQGNTGWNFFNDGGLCLEGAIAAASGVPVKTDTFLNIGERYVSHTDIWACPAYQAVGEYLGMDTKIGSRLSSPKQSLWQWNDNKAKTAEDVIAVLRAAAAVERVKENADQLTLDFAA